METTTCRGCSRSIPKRGLQWCDTCIQDGKMPAQRPASAPWSPGRKRSTQATFRQRLMGAYGGQCCAVGGLTTFQDLPQGTRCRKLDRSVGGQESLQAHHGKNGMPDMLLCEDHHAVLDPHARVTGR